MFLRRVLRQAEEVAATEVKTARKKPANMFDLIAKYPGPKFSKDPAETATWKNKNGFGLKMYRSTWRYPEPCYWTITKFKSSAGGRPKVWGIKTWRGKVENETPKQITCTKKRQWRVLEDESKWLESGHIKQHLQEAEHERRQIWHIPHPNKPVETSEEGAGEEAEASA